MDNKIPPCPACGKVPVEIHTESYSNGGLLLCGCDVTCDADDWYDHCAQSLYAACRELGIETEEQLRAKVQPDPRVAALEAKVKRLLNGIDQHETHKQFVFGVTQHMGKSEPSAADKDLWALKSAESEGSVV